ncbi:MAG TPA: SRPBCC family protein [Gemmatimonadaceae bacterium]|nr:SRPBCC family protein [Gemmatimonadaceae bacterium]
MPNDTLPARADGSLGPMPLGRAMETVDERLVRAPARAVFDVVRAVEEWPAHLAHYRYVRYERRDPDGGGLVVMAANRPFGLVSWPTWWRSEMRVDHEAPAIRFLHVGGITTGMDVEWTFTERDGDALVRIVHAWNGPRWPLIGVPAAVMVIGPVFIHGIASRTLAGLARVTESSRASARGNT